MLLNIYNKMTRLIKNELDLLLLTLLLVSSSLSRPTATIWLNYYI